MKRTKEDYGITLVALVVTIVVLLILVGITLIYVLGYNGIFKLAQDAKDKTEQAKKDEQEYVSNVDNTINKYVNGNGGTTNSSTQPENPNPPARAQTVAEIVGKKQDGTITVEDANKNKITVPKGFTIVPNSGEKPSNKTEEQWNAEKVIYSYNGDGTPAIQDGIVIEDESGNQFVWIPIGNINNNPDDTEHGATSTITLGRYTFDSNGNPIEPKQEATTDDVNKDGENYYTKAVTIKTYYQELPDSIGNTPAEDLKGFIDSSKTNGGYYFARYEASNNGSNKPMSKANQTVWNKITQPDAATYARGMYNENEPMKSDLVNSYAWDTAIIFIQTYSKGNSNYANQTTKKSGSSLFATGASGDSACNIHDMASNGNEWITEHSTDKDSAGNCPCVFRGGRYGHRTLTTSGRINYSASYSPTFSSFRPLCYVK